MSRKSVTSPAMRRLLLVVAAISLSVRPGVAQSPSRPAPAAPDAGVTGSVEARLPALVYPRAAPKIEAPAVVTEPVSKRHPPTVSQICRVIQTNADSVGMDRDFFARLIWKESRFDVGAVSPVGAQGIAQFMPYTAAERGLQNPYDFEEAIRHSATYLRDLKGELGNWGLAAAAYNGGINRVKRWSTSGGSLPFETENYVASITGRAADWFLEDGHQVEAKPLDADLEFLDSCAKLPVMRTRALYASVGVESAPMKPWGVQVAGHESHGVAMRMFKRVQSTYPSILGGIDPIVTRSRTSPRRRIYAVRIGADTRSEAAALCGKLQRAGGSCLVLKN